MSGLPQQVTFIQQTAKTAAIAIAAWTPPAGTSPLYLADPPPPGTAAVPERLARRFDLVVAPGAPSNGLEFAAGCLKGPGAVLYLREGVGGSGKSIRKLR